jgi:hypothetical protein
MGFLSRYPGYMPASMCTKPPQTRLYVRWQLMLNAGEIVRCSHEFSDPKMQKLVLVNMAGKSSYFSQKVAPGQV